ncbi:50S ribosomal protein L24 [Candidatus Woesearchaeota archaeon]|nr:50S ribosomal protein L24 [Candidatus Woesearchaeota archaeon]
MKEFSSSWKSSGKPGKQRKYVANAPLHVRRGFFAAHLSKQLREKYRRRSVQLRKGDTVRVMRGRFRGKAGKVEVVDLKRFEVYISGIDVKKRDGTSASSPVHPSNLQVTELNTEDKRRF